MQRVQQTLANATRVQGFGLFRGLDVSVELRPAPENHGIVFRRTDLTQPVDIPALVEFVQPAPRHTAIAWQGATVETIEHIMAALAALRVDNCLIAINAPEVATLDGSSLGFIEAIDAAGIVPQTAARQQLVVRETVVLEDGPHVGIAAEPPRKEEFRIGYILNYGPGPIPAQSLCLDITDRSFREHLGYARTFALESEVRQLHAAGLGLRATARDACVFGEQGLIDNQLRVADECVRHKILDCIGDFALAGCDLVGRFTALRTGHRLNHELIRRLRQSATQTGTADGNKEQMRTRKAAPVGAPCRVAG